MNFLISNWQPCASHHLARGDDATSDWLGGEAWVTPQPFGIEGIDSIDGGCDEDPAADWTPL